MHLVRRGHHLIAALEVDPELQPVSTLRADGHLGVHDAFSLEAEEGEENETWAARGGL